MVQSSQRGGRQSGSRNLDGGGFAVVISDSHSALEYQLYWQRGWWVCSISSGVSDCACPDAMYSHRKDHADVGLDL